MRTETITRVVKTIKPSSMFSKEKIRRFHLLMNKGSAGTVESLYMYMYADQNAFFGPEMCLNRNGYFYLNRDLVAMEATVPASLTFALFYIKSYSVVIMNDHCLSSSHTYHITVYSVNN